MSETLLDFPCEFPLKIMGRNEMGFQALVMKLIEPHAGPLAADDIHTRLSRDGNFVALTLTLRAETQVQLDAVYSALSGHDQVLMVL